MTSDKTFTENILRKYQVYPLSADSVFGIDLQWFAAEDEGRTEDPTERKIRKAREEGKVAKSSDITSAVVLLFGLLALLIMADDIVSIVSEMLRFFITISTEQNGASNRTVTAVGYYLLRLTLPFMAVCYLAAFLGNVVQVGFLFSTKPITPDFSKISPNFGRWAKKAMFSTEALFNFTKSIAKVAIIVTLAYINIRKEIPNLVNAVKYTPLKSMTMVSTISIKLMLETAILLLFFALPDFLFQKAQHKESLKMTKHEVKEEFKETEGDPLIKSRLRQRMQELLSASIAQEVPQSDVVITNPTHFAVALKWDSMTMHAPSVTAKGQDNIALRIKEIARSADVPIVENKPLARALYHNVDVGDEIPEEYWEVVSIVLAEVYKLSGRAV